MLKVRNQREARDSERSDISAPSVIVAIVIHAVIVGALIYNVHMSTDIARPGIAGATGAVRRDRDTTGTWQGSFAGTTPTNRIVRWISDGRVKCAANVLGIDDAEPDRMMRGSATLLNDSAIQIVVPALNGRFAGVIAANGTVIAERGLFPECPRKIFNSVEPIPQQHCAICAGAADATTLLREFLELPSRGRCRASRRSSRRWRG
jgi:hypothetical protein